MTDEFLTISGERKEQLKIGRLQGVHRAGGAFVSTDLHAAPCKSAASRRIPKSRPKTSMLV